MLIDQLTVDPPMLHRNRDGTATIWRGSHELLRALDRNLSDGARTLETGAGLSTIVFAARGCHHTAVVPDPEQAERIRAWCSARGISTDRLTFVLEPSELALPRLEPTPLDVVLIDGAHGFPSPFIDWHYAGRRLRLGGVLVVDDTQIWTGSVLRGFLDADPQWELVAESRLDFACFRRVADGELGEWNAQPYVLSRSFTPNSPRPLQRTVGRVVALQRQALLALRLLRTQPQALLRRLGRLRRR